MTVLVTGGAGYIGSHMVLSLLDAGRGVVVLDDLSTGFRWAVPERAAFVEGDCGDTALVADVIRTHGVTAVIHFAGSIIVPESVTDPLGYYLNNTVKSRALIACAVAAGVRHVIFSSSAAVYGEPEQTPIGEGAALSPISPYGTSKMMTELMLGDAAAAHDLSYAALRYFNVAGADPKGRSGQSGAKATHLIKLASQAVTGERPGLDIYGDDYPTPDGTCIRDYIHVSDLAHAHLLALGHLERGGESLVLNCGYGHGYSVREVVDTVKRVSGADFPVNQAPRRPGDPASLVAGAERIHATLGWTPQFDDLDTIVSHALAWERALKSRRAPRVTVLSAEDDRAASAGRKPRIGVLMPAGRLIGRDQVVTYGYQDPDRSITAFTNIGDCFVYESSLRILDYAEVHPIFFSGEGGISERQYEMMNSLDYIFLRGSNYINTSGQWDPACDVLERIKVPVIAFGIGVQVPDGAEEYVNESTRRFLHLIADRSTTLGVRGELSARALRSIGIRNVRIIGCPTAFRHRRRTLSLQKVASSEIEQLGFTLRRKTYGSAMLQRYLLRTLAEQYPMTILCAGEVEDKAIYYASRGMIADAEAALAKATEALIDDGWIYGPDDPLLKLYKESLAVFESVADFENAVCGMSAVTGFRLHGNLMALANGVPALYVTYDTRTREFAQSLKIPAVGIRGMDRFQFHKAWDEADFATFEKGYAKRFAELEAFLEENGMAHRLEPAGASSLQAAE